MCLESVFVQFGVWNDTQVCKAMAGAMFFPDVLSLGEDQVCSSR